MFKKLSKFFKDSVSELKKVHWPTAKETKELTLSVITLAIFFGFILSLIDYLLGKIIYPLIIK